MEGSGNTSVARQRFNARDVIAAAITGKNGTSEKQIQKNEKSLVHLGLHVTI
jgi:hypothetical protein